MFEKFMSKTKEEKIEAAKKTGKVTLGLAGVGALSYIVGRALGFKDGIDWFWEKGRDLYEQKNEESEQIEDKEDGEA